MGFVGDFISDVFGGGDETSDAATQASQTEAKYLQDALEYLKEKEAIPRQYSEAALNYLGGLYGLEGGTGSQQDLIDQAISSPLYQAIMGGQEAGEESILRSAAATGGLRSGNVQSNLYDYNTQLQNQALLESYNQQLSGLTGLAGLSTDSTSSSIASIYGNIGETLASGITGSAQAEQSSFQQGFSNLLGLGGLGYMMFSDRRLKKNIKKIGEVNGHNWYMWDWNIVANKMGLHGQSEGILADELVDTHPDCIGIKDGFMIVDYTKLGIFPKEGIA